MITRRTMRINHWQRIVGGMVFKILGLEATLGMQLAPSLDAECKVRIGFS